MIETKEIRIDSEENTGIVPWLDWKPRIDYTVSSLDFYSASKSTCDSLNEDSLRELLKKNLDTVRGIQSVWMEDYGKELKIIFITDNVLNQTIYPILNFKYALQDKYEFLTMNFEINPLDFAERQIYHRMKRIS